MHLEDLWNFSDLDSTEATLKEQLDTTHEPSKQAEVLTQLARLHGLRGNFTLAHELLDTAMSRGESPRAQIRVQLERGRCYNSAGDRTKAMEMFLASVELAEEAHEEFLGIDALHMMAIATEPKQQIIWAERALAKTRTSDDPRCKRWLGPLLNNLGWSYHDVGDYPAALTVFNDSLQFRVETGERESVLIARWCVGRCHRSLGNLEQALRIQLELLTDRTSANETDIFVLEELAECYVGLSDPVSAAGFARQAAASADAEAALGSDRFARMRELAAE